tara:strand:+ start:44 stop:511 length:468 start_codon:yes stop_codon:yes gene_type:complete
MDKTQQYIIRQSSVKTGSEASVTFCDIKAKALANAVKFWANQESKTPEKCTETADYFLNWMIKGESLNPLPLTLKFADQVEKWVTRDGKTNNMFTPKEEDKKWLNQKTPEWSAQVKFLQEGGDIKEIFNKFKVSKLNREELEKIIKNKNQWQQRQ